ncbi:MAG: lipoprotein-releasing ABC transporter permease subunit [Gammaproteobacteria bacterium]|nr:lipoprotein-releasing ABC transporter permease subunit [Gammaproteobacteria bacterium]
MMFKDWRLQVAIRYSVSSTSDHLVSFMSLISIFGLVLGVAVLVIVLSVMNGFEQELRERVLGVVPHGVVYSHVPGTDWQLLMQRWEAHANIEAVAPLVEGSGLALANGELVGVSFTGIDPALESGVSIVQNHFVAGTLDGLTKGSFNVVLGQPLAARLNVDVGDKVTLVLPDLNIGIAGPMPTVKRFSVSGLFKVGSDLDKSQLYMHIKDAMKIQRQKEIDGVRVRVDDLFAAPEILHELVLTTGDRELYASSWMRRHGNLYDAIQMQKTTMFLLLLMLVAVAAFNVVSNLMMTVQDKYPDIAILRTIGASPGSIRAIFIMHGCFVGIAGITIGIVLGTILANWLGDIYGFLDESFGLGIMDEYFIQYLPTRVLASDIVVVATVSFVICVVATIYPASRAAAANPVETLQYEG